MGSDKRKPARRRWEWMRPDLPGTVYVLHFDREFQARNGYIRTHYVGWTSDIRERLRNHADGLGAQEVRTAVTRGFYFLLGNCFDGTPTDELLTRRRGQRNGWQSVCEVCAGGDPIEISLSEQD